jgi:hypothetical protein
MWEHWEHLWIPRPRKRYFDELLELISIHCLTVRKVSRRPKKRSA